MSPRALLSALRGPIMLALVYLALRFAFVRLSQDNGLFDPDGMPDPLVAGLGIAVLLLRLVLLALLPTLLLMRGVSAWRKD